MQTCKQSKFSAPIHDHISSLLFWVCFLPYLMTSSSDEECIALREFGGALYEAM